MNQPGRCVGVDVSNQVFRLWFALLFVASRVGEAPTRRYPDIKIRVYLWKR